MAMNQLSQKISSFFIVLFLVFIALIKASSAEVIDLKSVEGQAVVNVAPHAEYLSDLSHELSFGEVEKIYQENEFQPVGPVIDFGAQNATFWVTFRLRNVGEEPGTWILNTGSQRMRHAALYVVRDGKISAQVLDDFQRPFSERPIRYRLLVSELTLAPGEEVQVFYSYRSFKSSFFPIKVMTESAFSDEDRRQFFWTMVIAGTILMFAVYSVFLFFSLEDVAVIYYILFILATTTYILHQLGFTYSYFWPEAPFFNSRAALFLGFLCSAFGALYGHYFFLKKRREKIISSLYNILTVLSLIGVVASLTSGGQVGSHFIGTAGFLLVGFVSILNLFCSVRCYWQGDLSAGVAGLGWAIIILWNVFINALSFDVMRVPQQVIFDNFHIYTGFTMVLETMFLTLALFIRVRLIIRANNRERSEYIRLLEQEAQNSRAIAHALRDKRAAEEDAARKGRLVESIAHDIRQPLHAMKLFASPTRSQEASMAPAFEAVAMIEDILTTASNETTFSADSVGIQPEQIKMNQVLASISLVFTSQARQAGLKLTVAPSSQEVYFDRRILVRILNNLISNAIRYTGEGRILVGCRRRRNGVEIQVLDTGPGIESPNPMKLSMGLGMGLKIVETLCRRTGAEFKISNLNRGGTIASIRILLS